MRIAVFINQLGIGGTEKAACEWARQFSLFSECKGISVISMNDGLRKTDLEKAGIPVHIQSTAAGIAGVLVGVDVIHAHAPGFPHVGDVLGEAIKLVKKKIPVVQTNIFGKLENPRENAWTDFRLFISWTSCVQAARRSGRKLDLDFFRHQSVASYPVSPLSETEEAQLEKQALAFRESIGLLPNHVLFGRFSRPEPNKWTPMILPAFLDAHLKNPNLRLLLREPPARVASDLRLANLVALDYASVGSAPILILPATPDSHELAVSQMACDVILHTSSIGESFGYGIAEPMNLGIPVISNSVPWHDQAQIELVRHGECGHICSTASSLRAAILRMADDRASRIASGKFSKKHILVIADRKESTNRVKMAMRCAIENGSNPLAEQDLEKARETAEYLDRNQWGHTLQEKLWLESKAATIRFLRWQRQTRNGFKSIRNYFS